MEFEIIENVIVFSDFMEISVLIKICVIFRTALKISFVLKMKIAVISVKKLIVIRFLILVTKNSIIRLFVLMIALLLIMDFVSSMEFVFVNPIGSIFIRGEDCSVPVIDIDEVERKSRGKFKDTRAKDEKIRKLSYEMFDFNYQYEFFTKIE